MRTIGIIGGMGPLATVDLYAKIVYAAQGKKDRDHVPVLLSGRPDIPDRAASICGTGPSALPALLEEARRLEQAGADALCLGCNTAHFYYNALAAAIGIPIFHMPRLAGTYCQHKRLHKVILLAAPGTYETGIYEKAFSGTGVEIIRPEPAVQRLTAQCIYEGIKACRRDHRRTLIMIQLGPFFFAPLPCEKVLILWAFSASCTRITARAVSSFILFLTIFCHLQQKAHPG